MTAIKPVEIKRVALFFLLFFALGINTAISPNVSTALFSISVGPESLTFVYCLKFFCFIALTFGITYGMIRYSSLGFTRWLFFAFFVVLACNALLVWMIEYFALPSFSASIYLVLSTRAIMEAVEVVVWIVAANLFSSRQSTRLFAYLSAGYIVGQLFGSLFMFHFSTTITPEAFYLVCALAMAGATLSLFMIAQCRWVMLKDEGEQEDSTTLSTFMVFMHNSPHWTGILAVTLFAYGFFYLIDYHFNIIAEHTYPQEASLIKFYGVYEMLSSICRLIVVLAFFRFVLQRFGVWNALLLIPAMYALLFFANGLFFDNIYVVTLSRIASELCIELIIITTTLIYKAARKQYRGALMSFADSVTIGGGLLFSGCLGLLYRFEVLNLNELAFVLCSVAVCATIYVYSQRNEYRHFA